jgi:hypothetical protein
MGWPNYPRGPREWFGHPQWPNPQPFVVLCFFFFFGFSLSFSDLVGWPNHPQGPHEWFGHPQTSHEPPPWLKWGMVGHPQSHPFIFLGFFFNIFNFALVFKFNFLIEYVTRGKGIIGIFRENRSFGLYLVVCGAIV